MFKKRYGMYFGRVGTIFFFDKVGRELKVISQADFFKIILTSPSADEGASTRLLLSVSELFNTSLYLYSLC
jgi:hypothetical protein